LASLAVTCAAETVYNPPNAGKALDAVEQALSQILKLPHLTKAQLDQAKKVSSDVEKTVAELESPEGKKLSKEAHAAKVTAAIKELQDLQSSFSQSSTDRKAALMKQLKEKEAELEKDKKMMKVLTLEKKLAEKKLKLQKMIDTKNEQRAKEQAAKEAADQQEAVAKVVEVAKTMKDGKKLASDKLKPVMSYLEKREKAATDSLATLDAAEKKRSAEIEALTSAKMPVKDDKDPLAKSQGVLKMLAKKEHRAYLKARAPLASELKELKTAEDSIKKGDVAKLSEVMSHMQGEMKDLQAKSKKFLY